MVFQRPSFVRWCRGHRSHRRPTEVVWWSYRRRSEHRRSRSRRDESHDELRPASSIQSAHQRRRSPTADRRPGRRLPPAGSCALWWWCRRPECGRGRAGRRTGRRSERPELSRRWSCDPEGRRRRRRNRRRRRRRWRRSRGPSTLEGGWLPHRASEHRLCLLMTCGSRYTSAPPITNAPK